MAGISSAGTLKLSADRMARSASCPTLIDLNTWAILYHIGYRREVFERVGMRKTEYPWVYMREPAHANVEAREFCLTSS